MRDNYLRPPFVRMARVLHQIWECGWWPRRDTDDFVQCVPRHFNSSADHLANVALDGCESFSWQSDSARTLSETQRIVFTSDGGFRGSLHGSSASWIVWKLDVATKLADVAAFEYVFWRRGRSAFEAEMVALKGAMSVF